MAAATGNSFPDILQYFLSHVPTNQTIIPRSNHGSDFKVVIVILCPIYHFDNNW